jgi:phage-related tail protein
LTERAESSQREALEQRLETERILREQAERARDELAAELEALRETRVAELASDGEYGTETPGEDTGEPRGRSRSWWRRFFGFE